MLSLLRLGLSERMSAQVSGGELPAQTLPAEEASTTGKEQVI